MKISILKSIVLAIPVLIFLIYITVGIVKRNKKRKLARKRREIRNANYQKELEEIEKQIKN
jgi:choline-glycine betaine transporter